MPAKNPDLHGNVPEQSPDALLLIDVINDLEFPEGEQLDQMANFLKADTRPSAELDLRMIHEATEPPSSTESSR
jgi:hypothetical protein